MTFQVAKTKVALAAVSHMPGPDDNVRGKIGQTRNHAASIPLAGFGRGITLQRRAGMLLLTIACGTHWASKLQSVRTWSTTMPGFLQRLIRRPLKHEPAWIEATELHRRILGGEAIAVVDVRQPEEFTAPPGHLPTAFNIPLADLTGRIDELAALKRPLVMVCKTDRRSARAATELLAAGVRNVTVLRSGTDGWHRQGLALE
jgi:rhodanese-related sulfurtransferase